MNKLAITISIIVTAVLFTTTTALAHVVIDSKQGSSKAVFHISPADDPIAEKESTLYFDIQSSQASGNDRSASLAIYNGSVTTTVPATINNETVSAKYTFPKGGTYNLDLTVTSTDLSAEVLQFSYDQEVRDNSISNDISSSNNLLPIVLTAITLLCIFILFLISRIRLSTKKRVKH